MNLLHAFVLRLVQGLGEFLPISSSAHLILTPWLFHWPDPGLGFDVALHWGTLLAVLIYFRQDVWNIIKGFFHSLAQLTRDLQNNIWQKLAWLLIIASIPGAIFGALLESKAETSFRNPLLVAVDLAVFGLILWFVDSRARKIKNLDHVTWFDSLLIGISQGIAVIPGVSRSGATMTTGLALGFKREDAARFSFLMSMPIIFGAGILKLKDFGSGVTTAELVVGFISAAVFGFLAIKYMLNYIAKHNFRIFVWYRWVVALLVLIIYFIRR